MSRRAGSPVVSQSKTKNRLIAPLICHAGLGMASGSSGSNDLLV
jgi:hypothetical protein